MKSPGSLTGLRHVIGASALAALATVSIQAQIDSVTRLTAHLARWERVDFVVMLRAEWRDPYVASEIRLDLELNSPSGRSLVLPAYYERGDSGTPSEWRARFAPAETGTYRGNFVLTKGSVRDASPELVFTVAASAGKGFLHTAGPWIFRFDDGEPFRGIGENICWEARSADDSKHFKSLHEHPRFNYEYLLGQLSTQRGNFLRTWMCAWNLPLEWSHVIDTNRYTDDPRHFNTSAIARMDQFIELAASTDVYVMLALDPHGSLLGRQWELNPYNVRNGGPAASPADFFVNPAAKARYQDRLRYLVARWGYSPHLAVWEFFNEIDNAMYEQKPTRIPDDVITAWHAEMSAYLKTLDVYGRPITTSISHRDVAGLNEIPTLDFNQKHIYRNTASIPETIRRYVAGAGKPYVIGEFGYEWDWNKNFNEFADLMDRDFKHGLWLGLFSPTPILPMSWWWEFFDERKLTPYFASVREISDRMLAAGHGEFQEVECSAGAFSSLAVRCGPTTFAYVHNGGAATAEFTVQLNAPASSSPAVELYDPESRTWQKDLPATTANGRTNIPAVALRPGEAKILVVR